MKTIEIICCLFIVIFALAVSHPLHDNVLGDQVTKQDGIDILAQETVEAQLLPPSELGSSSSEMSQEDANEQQDSQSSEEDTKEQKRLLSTYANEQENVQVLDETNPQDSHTITFSDEALETIFNDSDQETKLQTAKEE